MYYVSSEKLSIKPISVRYVDVGRLTHTNAELYYTRAPNTGQPNAERWAPGRRTLDTWTPNNCGLPDSEMWVQRDSHISATRWAAIRLILGAHTPNISHTDAGRGTHIRRILGTPTPDTSPPDEVCTFAG